jgi:uncharacterized OB-fold protein
MTVPDLRIRHCEACGYALAPDAARCSRCSSTQLGWTRVEARGRVLAATELVSVAAGWTSPHRLALIEIPPGLRLLGIVDGALPSPGAPVSVRLEDGRIHVTKDVSSSR